jgi:hypothetical protein
MMICPPFSTLRLTAEIAGAAPVWDASIDMEAIVTTRDKQYD